MHANTVDHCGQMAQPGALLLKLVDTDITQISTVLPVTVIEGEGFHICSMRQDL